MCREGDQDAKAEEEGKLQDGGGSQAGAATEDLETRYVLSLVVLGVA